MAINSSIYPFWVIVKLPLLGLYVNYKMGRAKHSITLYTHVLKLKKLSFTSYTF